MQFSKLIKRNQINFFVINLIVKFYANIVPIYLHKTCNYKNETCKANSNTITKCL